MFKNHIHIEKAPLIFQQTEDHFQIQYDG